MRRLTRDALRLVCAAVVAAHAPPPDEDEGDDDATREATAIDTFEMANALSRCQLGRG